MPLVEVSVGELLDKWSILEIKSKRLKKPKQQQNIQSEMGKLAQTCKIYLDDPAIGNLYEELFSANLSIWLGMDEYYALDSAAKSEFIDLTIRITELNKVRAYLKKEIDNKFESEFSEEKSYF
jgi:hypothetical protein